MKKWMQHWIDAAKNQDLPVYFVRFEDLTANPKSVLEEIFKFFLDTNNLEGTVVEQRIKDICDQGKETSIIYKPRVGGGINRQM